MKTRGDQAVVKVASLVPVFYVISQFAQYLIEQGMGRCNTLCCTMLDYLYMECAGNGICAKKGSDDDHTEQN